MSEREFRRRLCYRTAIEDTLYYTFGGSARGVFIRRLSKCRAEIDSAQLPAPVKLRGTSWGQVAEKIVAWLADAAA